MEAIASRLKAIATSNKKLLLSCRDVATEPSVHAGHGCCGDKDPTVRHPKTRPECATYLESG